MGRFLAGAIAAIAVGVIGVLALILLGYVPARADRPPSPLEEWAANTSLDATLAREAPASPYPSGPENDAAVIDGAKTYMAQCAVCHGSGSGDASNLARGLYVRPPQFNKHDVDDDPEGETYWKVEHGIRFTGMPAYGGLLSEDQIWHVAAFLKHGMHALPPAAAQIWNQPHGD